MAASVYDFPDHIKGDTFLSMQFTVNVDGSPLSLVGSTIRMYLRDSSGVIQKRLDNATNGGITLVTPASGIFKIDTQVIDIPAGKYNYDMEFTLSSGAIHTYVRGTWVIIQDVTY